MTDKQSAEYNHNLRVKCIPPAFRRNGPDLTGHNVRQSTDACKCHRTGYDWQKTLLKGNNSQSLKNAATQSRFVIACTTIVATAPWDGPHREATRLAVARLLPKPKTYRRMASLPNCTGCSETLLRTSKPERETSSSTSFPSTITRLHGCLRTAGRRRAELARR